MSDKNDSPVCDICSHHLKTSDGSRCICSLPHHVCCWDARDGKRHGYLVERDIDMRACCVICTDFEEKVVE